MLKRSNRMTLALMSLAPVMLTACSSSSDGTSLQAANKPPSGPSIYDSIDSCVFDGHAKEACIGAFQSANEESKKVAPRFKTQADCELEFEFCQKQDQALAASSPAAASSSSASSVPAQAGGGSFMPMMFGFMMGQAMSGGSSAGYAGAPSAGFNSSSAVYKNRAGQMNTLSKIGDSVKSNSVTARTVDAKAVNTMKASRAATRSASTRASSSRSAGFGRSGGFGG